ncbi:hypothetical protein GGF31_004556 [Allomyces arbusculus]|nr:hypothetical protein GGF31_004556 [Allomyces arbusculus]
MALPPSPFSPRLIIETPRVNRILRPLKGKLAYYDRTVRATPSALHSDTQFSQLPLRASIPAHLRRFVLQQHATELCVRYAQSPAVLVGLLPATVEFSSSFQFMTLVRAIFSQRLQAQLTLSHLETTFTLANHLDLKFSVLDAFSDQLSTEYAMHDVFLQFASRLAEREEFDMALQIVGHALVRTLALAHGLASNLADWVRRYISLALAAMRVVPEVGATVSAAVDTAATSDFVYCVAVVHAALAPSTLRTDLRACRPLSLHLLFDVATLEQLKRVAERLHQHGLAAHAVPIAEYLLEELHGTAMDACARWIVEMQEEVEDAVDIVPGAGGQRALDEMKPRITLDTLPVELWAKIIGHLARQLELGAIALAQEPTSPASPAGTARRRSELDLAASRALLPAFNSCALLRHLAAPHLATAVLRDSPALVPFLGEHLIVAYQERSARQTAITMAAFHPDSLPPGATVPVPLPPAVPAFHGTSASLARVQAQFLLHPIATPILVGLAPRLPTKIADFLAQRTLLPAKHTAEFEAWHGYTPTDDELALEAQRTAFLRECGRLGRAVSAAWVQHEANVLTSRARLARDLDLLARAAGWMPWSAKGRDAVQAAVAAAFSGWPGTKGAGSRKGGGGPSAVARKGDDDDWSDSRRARGGRRARPLRRSESDDQERFQMRDPDSALDDGNDHEAPFRSAVATTGTVVWSLHDLMARAPSPASVSSTPPSSPDQVLPEPIDVLLEGPRRSSEATVTDKIGRILRAFVALSVPDTPRALRFPPTISSYMRRLVHERAQSMGLASQSYGSGRGRFLVVSDRTLGPQ